MTPFVFLHGAWTGPWIWEPLLPELSRRGHQAVLVDLPGEDVDAGTSAYADAVLDAAAAAGLADAPGGAVVVAHSLGGLVAPLLPARMPVQRIVYVAPILPEPRSSLMEQFLRGDPIALGGDEGRWADERARTFWMDEAAFHRLCTPDFDDDAAAAMFGRLRRQARMPIREVTPLRAWPDVPSSAIIYRDDAVLNNEWAARVLSERLGVARPIELPGAHFAHMRDPVAFVEAIERPSDGARST